MADKILEVKNLKISFRTTNGKVQAVRDISFDLMRGETLAIVGESGSGKSVTSRAILGILAGNAIVESGSILYDGQDLMRIDESDFHKIRGDKVAMIFQDPLSSLNPVVKIGRQLTEAMLLKNKSSRKEARRTFNDKLALLTEQMWRALVSEGMDEATAKETARALTKKFDEFNITATKLQNAYNEASNSFAELENIVPRVLLNADKKQSINYKEELRTIVAKINKAIHPFVLKKENIQALLTELKEAEALCTRTSIVEDAVSTLRKLEAVINEVKNRIEPDFFTIGYYLHINKDADVWSTPVDELNAMTGKFLNDDFMLDFMGKLEKALRYADGVALEKKAAVVSLIADTRPVFSKEALDKKESAATAELLAKAVKESINRLDVYKDSLAYTFPEAVTGSLERYFLGIKKNPKAQAVYERQLKKYNSLVARGKVPDWKVTPAQLIDLELTRGTILEQMDRLEAKYIADCANANGIDYSAKAVEFIDFMKETAAEVVNKMTKSMAKLRAIKLMEEVGIPEPARRYNQYPFEFSGGMRQRIVIAIALSADPDILICDEPTTALDVTIQSQILELINDLKEKRKLSIIFITHNLGVVANMADRVAVMYAGKIVEYGTVNELFYEPAHPYTWALLSSMPDLDTKERLEAIPGTPPNMIYPPVGDAFAERNKYALEIDFEQQPPLFEITPTHYAATWLLHPDAPKVEMPVIIRERIERVKNMGGQNNG